MQRLFVAVLLLAILLAGLILAYKLLRQIAGGPATGDGGGTAMQRIAFALLAALIVYAAFAGAG